MVDTLILEDDRPSRDALVAWFEARGVTCRACGSVGDALSSIADALPDLAVLDVELPDGSGLDVLRELGASQDTWVVMASGKTTIDSAIESLRLGADDFLQKPIELERLEVVLKNAARTRALRAEVDALRAELRRLGRFGALVGDSPQMQAVYDAIGRIARTDETVLLTGPTGSGKEVAAVTIHRLSGRAAKPFVAINCGAVSPTLIESEFFGHERGAFTGADRRRAGVFEQAHGGTLFLDEITEMPLELQVKLLRVLETSRVTRLGGAKELDVDVRILAATNRDPKQAVADGALREDLMYRLLVFPIEMPPLAGRGRDVLMLAQAFLDEVNEEHDVQKTFTDAALAALGAHSWPGNVRELRNVVRRAFVMADTHIDVGHLPLGNGPSAPSVAGASAAARDGVLLRPDMSIADAEQALIELTLAHLGGDKKAAAASLGISLKTLYARLKVYAAARGED